MPEFHRYKIWVWIEDLGKSVYVENIYALDIDHAESIVNNMLGLFFKDYDINTTEEI